MAADEKASAFHHRRRAVLLDVMDKIELKSTAFYRMTWLLSLAAVVVFANLHALQPLLPELSRSFELSALQTSWAYASGTLALGLSLLVYGAWSDAIGRKPLLLMSFIGMAISTLALTQVESYAALLGWRVLQGCCLGALPAIAIAYMGEELSSDAMVVAVGYYISASSLGGISGRVLAGASADLGHWPWVFYPLALASVLLWWGCYRYLPDSRHFQASPFALRPALHAMVNHLKNRRLLALYVIGGINFFIYLNQYTYISFVLAEAPFHWSSGAIGLLFLTYLTGTLGSAWSSRISQRLGAAPAMALGIGIMMLGTVVTLWLSVVAIVAGFFINAFGFFIAHSVASGQVNRQASHAKASASALYLVFYYVGASSGGLYLHPFWQWHQWHGVVLGSCLLLLLPLLLAAWLWRTEHRTHGTGA
jgi:YNFM family putative membrane transporter